MPASDSKVVARIGKPLGLAGEVTVQVHTDDPDARFVVGTRYRTQPAFGGADTTGNVGLTIRSARRHRGIWVLAFEGFPDRTGAESLRGLRLLVPAGAEHDATTAAHAATTAGQAAMAAHAATTAEQAATAGHGDTTAEQAATAGDAGAFGPVTDDDGWYEDDLLGLAAVTPSGEVLGEVSGLAIGTAQDLLRVRLVDGRTALVPFVTAIVPDVDLTARRVVVDAPPGLLDLAE